MRKPRTSDKTTAQLLKEAALSLFAKYGYEGTSVRDIAARAGVTAGQITVNYGSKENLFNEIVKDIYGLTCVTFDPIISRYTYLKQEGKLTEADVWEMIEQIVNIQVDFSFDPGNINVVQIINVHTFNEEMKASSMLATMTINKIEDTLARLMQEVFKDKHYLHARAVSRAVNGSIVSFAEHPNLLLNEVLHSKYMPESQIWMKEYVRSFILGSIRMEAEKETEKKTENS